MKKSILIFGYTFYLGAIVLSFYAQKAFAISCDQPGHPCTILDATPIVPILINIVLIVSGIIFFFTIVLAGFNFITANADPQRIENARKSFLVSLLGFALIYMPFFIIPKIIEIVGTTSNLHVQGSAITISLDSPFTATPLPPYLYSHTPIVTIAPVSANTENNADIPDTYQHSGTTCNENKIAYCMIDGYVGPIDQSQSLDGALAETLNAYRNFEGCNNLQMSVIASTVVSATDAVSYLTQKANQIGAKDCNVPAFHKFHAFAAQALQKGNLVDAATIELLNFAHVGLPTIAHIANGYVIIDDANAGQPQVTTNGKVNEVDFVDPANLISCSQATCSDNQKHMSFSNFMSLWDGTMLMLQPAGDPGDAIYSLFGGVSQITPIPLDVAKVGLFQVMMGECIALHESNFNENAVGHNPPSGKVPASTDNGTMQINDIFHFSQNFSMADVIALIKTLSLDSTTLATLNQPLQDFKNSAGGYFLNNSSVYNSVFNVEAAYEIYHHPNPSNSFLYPKWSTYIKCW